MMALALALLLALQGAALGGVAQGSYRGPRAWQAVEVLLLPSGASELALELRFPLAAPVAAALYTSGSTARGLDGAVEESRDELARWRAMLSQGLDCAALLARADRVAALGDAPPLEVVGSPRGPQARSRVNWNVDCARARFVLVAIGSCGSSSGLDASWELRASAGDGALRWLGASERAELVWASALLAVYAALLLLGLRPAARGLAAKRKLHATVRLLAASAGAAAAALALRLVALAACAATGAAPPWLDAGRAALQQGAELALLILALLLAKGWTVCCRRVSAAGRVTLAVMGAAYAAAATLCLVEQGQALDAPVLLRGAPLAAGAGWALAALRAAGALWLVRDALHSAQKWPGAASFFKIVCFLLVPWMLALPAAMLCALALPDQSSDTFAQLASALCTLTAQTGLALLFDPREPLTGLPFTSTTTQMHIARPADSYRDELARAARCAAQLNRSTLHSSRFLARCADDMLAILAQVDPARDGAIDEDLPTGGAGARRVAWGRPDATAALSFHERARAVSTELRSCEGA
jgi:hypothetical protein